MSNAQFSPRRLRRLSKWIGPFALLFAVASSAPVHALLTSTPAKKTTTTTTLAKSAPTPTTVPLSQIVASSTTDQAIGMPNSSLDLTAIPLGTDKASTAPQVGSLYRCGGAPSGGPPVHNPPWINTAGKTWNETTKAAVQGDVTWNASFSATHSGKNEILTGNGLPPRSGTFPVASTDPADAYNPDPGSITSHTIRLVVPYDPSMASKATCESAAVGIAINGIPILDGFDAGGNDAAAIETQDTCHGHPNDVVGYHYHGLSPCLLSTYARSHTALVGWALDGYGIYVEYNAAGDLLTNQDLDACHGRTSLVPWHGKMVRIYHYDMTTEFPYSVGCFRGTPTSFAGMTISGTAPGGSQGSGGGQGGGAGQGGASQGGAGQGGAGQGGSTTPNGGPPSGGQGPGQGPGQGGGPPPPPRT